MADTLPESPEPKKGDSDPSREERDGSAHV